METIVEKFILQLEAQLAERRVAITLEPEARAWLAEKGYDPVYGARPLARVIQTEVRDPLTDEILFGRLENGGTVTIALADGRRSTLRSRYRVRASADPRQQPERSRLMSDNEHDIPVKVVDRRWWASGDEARADREPSSGSLKPTYVEELEQQLAEKDRIAQEYIAKYRQAASEFEEARLRLRREISKDVERAAARCSADLLEVVDNLDRAIDAARRLHRSGCAAPGGRDGPPPVPHQAGGARREADRREGADVRSA